MTSTPEVRVISDVDGAARALAAHLVRDARARVSSTGRFTLALTGGNTPRRLYEALGTVHRDDFPWAATEFFWSDERAVPPDDAGSNHRLAREMLLAHGLAPDTRIHPMIRSAEDAQDLERAAVAYEQRLRERTGDDRPSLDAVLLGLGEDGHVASLFPRARSLREQMRSVIVVRDSPKPPPVRLTMTVPLINRSAAVHLLVAGDDKADAVQATLDGARDPDRWPAQQIELPGGLATWWLDAGAASRLRRR
jgi:6-phosphogluconolactonase